MPKTSTPQTFAKWTVTANRDKQSAEFEVYGYGRADWRRASAPT
jgi:hypothetical protein